MGTTAQKLQAIRASKAAIKAAIEAKGVSDVGNVLSQYAAKIASIPTGGGGQTGHLVRWIDYDGTVLKEERVQTGQAATPPDDPVHEGLTFEGWNRAAAEYASISHLTIIGALYHSSDGKVHMKTSWEANECAVVSVSFSGDGVTVDWGDGTIETATDSWLMHTYEADGQGEIVVAPLEGGAISEIQVKDKTSEVSVPAGMYSLNAVDDAMKKIAVPGGLAYLSFDGKELKGIVVPAGCNANGAGLNIENVSMAAGSGLTFVNTNWGIKELEIPAQTLGISFGSVMALEEAYLPDDMTEIPDGAFSYCLSLSKVNFPANLVTIGENAFANTALGHITFPDSLEEIKHSAFAYCKRLFIDGGFPEGLTTIAGYVFEEAPLTLGELVIPDHITSYGECYGSHNQVFTNSKFRKITFTGLSYGDGAYLAGSEYAWAVMSDSLEEFEIANGYVLENNLNLSQHYLLKAASIVGIFNALGQAGNYTDIILNSSAEAELSPDDIAIATGKGYSVSFV